MNRWIHIRNLLDLNQQKRAFDQRRREQRLIAESRELVSQLQSALAASRSAVPVFVVCYNNGIYVENTVRQLQAYGIEAIIFDNDSRDEGTRSVLAQLEQQRAARVLRAGKNFGHLVGFIEPVYPLLPEVFAYTDPDLQFNPGMPADFLEQLAGLTTEFKVYKAGLALELPEALQVTDKVFSRTIDTPFKATLSFGIRDWESQFWRKRLHHATLPVWAADIDTTFAVYRKSHFTGNFYDAVRVSGDYGALHLPWFPALDLFSAQHRAAYQQGNRSTTWH